MASSPPTLLRLSQGHLNLLTACPRKFQHSFIEQLGTADVIAQQERLLQGARFHLVLQQWLLDLPVNSVLAEETQLQQWLMAFQAAAPQILDAEAQQQPESDRTLEFASFLLTVRYDLLLIGNHHAKILDWKTYPRPQNAHWLEQNWQTRLYPFVLAETSAYLPEQISMVYWFFQTEQATATPQSLTFQYNTSKHEQTRQELTQLLNQLSHWLSRYQAGEPFPQVGWGSAQCEVCSFAARCGRTPVSSDNTLIAEEDRAIASAQLPNVLPTLSEIAEIPL
ncbi:MAG: PD-(D/E)XK nuclease family protein [Oscillatoriales cyanobacterium C42_A2020_001]|nr:PD-(D/E)XK nuclease family protein [Leptolyngbyaceae cyanobacterium C42_A2020_001]